MNRTAVLNTFAYLTVTVNFACNFAHGPSPRAENSAKSKLLAYILIDAVTFRGGNLLLISNVVIDHRAELN